MDSNNILNSLNGIVEKFSLSFGEDFFKLLDEIILITPRVLKEEPLKHIFSASENGIILIANSLILFYSCYYIFSRIVNMYNGVNGENVSYFVIKLVIVVLLVNNSYYICEQILNFNELFSSTISEFSNEVINKEPNFANLQDEVMKLEDVINNDNLTLDGIIKSMISFSSISLIIVFAIRYVTIIFLIIISPLALMCMFSNITRGISKTWGKVLFVNLIIEVFIKLIILIPLAYKKEDIIYKVILLGSIYVLLRINNFVKEFVAQIALPRINR